MTRVARRAYMCCYYHTHKPRSNNNDGDNNNNDDNSVFPMIYASFCARDFCGNALSIVTERTLPTCNVIYNIIIIYSYCVRTLTHRVSSSVLEI